MTVMLPIKVECHSFAATLAIQAQRPDVRIVFDPGDALPWKALSQLHYDRWLAVGNLVERDEVIL